MLKLSLMSNKRTLNKETFLLELMQVCWTSMYRFLLMKNRQESLPTNKSSSIIWQENTSLRWLQLANKRWSPKVSKVQTFHLSVKILVCPQHQLNRKISLSLINLDIWWQLSKLILIRYKKSFSQCKEIHQRVEILLSSLVVRTTSQN